MKLSQLIIATLIPVFSLGAYAAPSAPDEGKPAIERQAERFEPIPANKDDDLRVFYPDGKIVKGEEALGLMLAGKTGLNIWLAGNQFFAMEEVVHAFQRQHKEAVGVITMPAVKVMNAVLKGGWVYNNKDYVMSPDTFGVLDKDSMKKLKAAGKCKDYLTYMHNRLVLMVAKDNPKHIQGIADLGRPDLQIMLPNPVNEGIMKFYAKKVLQQNDLWDKLSGGKECQACYGSPNVYFTVVHHRESPEGISAGKVDVGIVWATEYQNAVREDMPVSVVNLPEKDSLKDEVNYFAGNVPGAPHTRTAVEYLKFLGTQEAQNAYAKFGFIGANESERIVREIE